MATRNALTGRVGPQIMPSGLNEDTKQAFASLDALGGISADLLLPGHGEPWTGGGGPRRSPGPRPPGAHSHDSVPWVVSGDHGADSRQPRPRALTRCVIAPEQPTGRWSPGRPSSATVSCSPSAMRQEPSPGSSAAPAPARPGCPNTSTARRPRPTAKVTCCSGCPRPVASCTAARHVASACMHRASASQVTISKTCWYSSSS
jgi:hypothetical protein